MLKVKIRIAEAKPHNLHKFRKFVNAFQPAFCQNICLNKHKEKLHLEMLCKIYVDTRYKRSYIVTYKKPSWLVRQMKEPEQVTKILCQEKIRSFSIQR